MNRRRRRAAAAARPAGDLTDVESPVDEPLGAASSSTGIGPAQHASRDGDPEPDTRRDLDHAANQVPDTQRSHTVEPSDLESPDPEPLSLEPSALEPSEPQLSGRGLPGADKLRGDPGELSGLDTVAGSGGTGTFVGFFEKSLPTGGEKAGAERPGGEKVDFGESGGEESGGRKSSVGGTNHGETGEEKTDSLPITEMPAETDWRRHSGPRYGDRVEGWVRPQYQDDPEPAVGDYWTPVPGGSYDAEYGWPVPVERLPKVPLEPPPTRPSMPVDAETQPIASEPQQPTVPTPIASEPQQPTVPTPIAPEPRRPTRSAPGPQPTASAPQPTVPAPEWPPARPDDRVEVPRSWSDTGEPGTEVRTPVVRDQPTAQPPVSDCAEETGMVAKAAAPVTSRHVDEAPPVDDHPASSLAANATDPYVAANPIATDPYAAVNPLVTDPSVHEDEPSTDDIGRPADDQWGTPEADPFRRAAREELLADPIWAIPDRPPAAKPDFTWSPDEDGRRPPPPPFNLRPRPNATPADAFPADDFPQPSIDYAHPDQARLRPRPRPRPTNAPPEPRSTVYVSRHASGPG